MVLYYNDLTRNCKPPIEVTINQIGKIIVIEVKEGLKKPYACSSGYYRRLNGTTQKMSHEELEIMFIENDSKSFEIKTASHFTFEDISDAKVRAFAKEANIRLGRTSIEDFLRSLSVASQNQVNNAGIMFFANNVYKYIHQSQMVLAAFKGVERLHIYDRRDVRDDLLTQFNEAMAFIKRHLNVRSEIKGVNRYDIYEIPLEVLREAVVNAIVHRDYTITGTQIGIEIYDDRVEIVNPGGLPRGLNKSKLGNLSVRRNEIIADLFYRLDKVERMGHGIKKMRSAMLAAGLRKPKFESDFFFTATFYRSPEFSLKQTTQVGLVDGLVESVEKTTQKTTQKMMELIKKDPTLTRAKMALELGITSDGVKFHIKQMKAKGLIRRMGSDKGGTWVIIE